MSHPVKSPRKLIEVALPLDAINEACAYEKMPGIGAHPRGIHLWWARRPLAAARAVIFAQLVNDPGSNIGRGFKYGKNKKEAAVERARLFRIIEDLVKWENSTNAEVLERARTEIRRSWIEVCELNKSHPQAKELFNPDVLPGLHDPFAGGGAIPVEAQRLGLRSFASDLNPVPVLINKAMIEIPPRFAGYSPIGPFLASDKSGRLNLQRNWVGVSGLAEDVRRYGKWVCEEAQKRVGAIYPSVEITTQVARKRPDLLSLAGQKRDVIAWIWVRTVNSPNPAFSHVPVPLAASFVLANKDGRAAYVQPHVEGDKYWFEVKMGEPPAEAKNGTKASRGANFRCILSNSPIEPDYIKAEGTAKRMGARMMAIVAEGQRGRIYVDPSDEAEKTALAAIPEWEPDGLLVEDARAFTPYLYGFQEWKQLYSNRQLKVLGVLSELICEVREKICEDASHSGQFPEDGNGLEANGAGARAYAEAVSVYLSFALDRCADFSNTMTRWVPGNEKVMNLFGKQAIGMTWDYPEAAILRETVGGYVPAANYIADCIEKLPAKGEGSASQADAQRQTVSQWKCISTDPPYYDNVPYADLSDFFYVWLRRCLRDVFPELLATITVPKREELVATTYRHGSRANAEAFFLHGMTEAIHNLALQAHPECPVTIYYAFKQSETSDDSGTSSTGWETFLNAVLAAGFAIVGTWPLRSEQEFRMRGLNSNALASSVVLVCRKRALDATSISRREFLRELNQLLPEALDEMTKGAGDDRSPVAPVDLSQAIIGSSGFLMGEAPVCRRKTGCGCGSF